MYRFSSIFSIKGKGRFRMKAALFFDEGKDGAKLVSDRAAVNRKLLRDGFPWLLSERFDRV